MKSVVLILATSLLGASSFLAEIVPTLSTKNLVDHADLVIVGKIETAKENGASYPTFGKVKNYLTQDYIADISVDETLKGEPVPRRFVFTFSVPSAGGAAFISKKLLGGPSLRF